MDNKENKHQNDNNQPKMPKFNMNWIYTVILIALCILFITGGGDALAIGSSAKQEATYTKFKEYVEKGYAKSVVINKDRSTITMYVKAKNIRDVFGKNAQQVGPEPSVKVEFGSVDELEKYLTSMQKAGKITDFSYENEKGNSFMNLLINRARKRGEHFELHPLDPRYDSTGSKPKLIVALIPMAVLFLLFNIWKLNINICLLCSIALSLVLFWPQLRRRDLKAMLNSGAVDSVPMTMTVAAICGFAGVITNTDAFQSMITAITSISIAPILICWVVVALMCMLTGGSSTGQLVALPIIAPKLQALGLTASTIHRVSAFAATTLDSMPYSGSILMLLPMCHMKLKEVYPALFVTTVIATTVGTAAVTLMCVLFPGLA